MWKLYYTQIVSSLHDSFNERFFLLVAWGDYGAFAHNWKDSFSELGILHLLVLSGSQMTLLVHSQTKLFLFITRNQLLKNFRVFLPIFLFFSSFYYLRINEYSPPLLRAFIFFWISSILSVLGKPFLAAPLSFITHIIVATAQIKSLSFCLSWASFLFLLILQKIEIPQWLRIVYLSLLSQIVVIFLTNQSELGFNAIIRLLIANIVFAYIFESYLSFILAILLSTSSIMAIIPNFLSDSLLALLKSIFPFLGRGLMILIHLARNTLLWV